MNMHPMVLADQDRLELFALLGQSRRLFHEARTWTDAAGFAWTGTRTGSVGIALTWLGPGWVFDPVAQQERAEEYKECLQEMRKANEARHQRQLKKAVSEIRLGGHAERLLWAIHNAVHQCHSSLLHLPDCWLAEAVWGSEKGKPQHWHQTLLMVLRSLAWLHAAPWTDDGAVPPFGLSTALLTHVGDLRGTEDDVCPDDCLVRNVRHHHIQIDVGLGFLGVLEQFGRADLETGVRTYSFPTERSKKDDPALRRVGKTGKLISVFMPAKLGEPSACAAYTPHQHRLLQSLLRETTRAKRKSRKEVSEPEVFTGNLIAAFHGDNLVACPKLRKDVLYVGFNGNKRRKGGYRLDTLKGWLFKGGYSPDKVTAFLSDLETLAKPLGLDVVGVSRSLPHVGLDYLLERAASSVGFRHLAQFHVRVYTAADYLERWSTVFQPMKADAATISTPPVDDAAVAKLLAEMKRRKASWRALARGINKDHSFLSKVLKGVKLCPKGLLEKAQAWVAGQSEPKPPRPAVQASGKTRITDDGTVLGEALRLLDRGWCVVPQRTGEKKPCVRWKPYQDRLPTEEEWIDWIGRWPDAGLTLVLGPVSGIFVTDVDGKEAHDVLMNRIGNEPICPKARSGSHKPYRYHLFFRCPDLPTKSKQTPWHEHLEFRGHGGIVIIPPSLHKSGNRYEWAKGRSPDDLELPELPPQILEALKPVQFPRPVSVTVGRRVSVAGIDASPRTLAFLSGRWVDGPRWNDKLFNAACDLCGRDMRIEKAEPLLLAGAQPWSQGEEERARTTILSAYSQPREPGRH